MTVIPNVGLPGFFVVSVANNMLGYGRIRLWEDPFKETLAYGVYTPADLPSTFYMEGVEPSSEPRQSVITVQYLFVGANGLPMAAGRDQLAATVTPVINNFTITGNGVRFINNTNGLEGMDSGLVGVPGAVFDATVTRTGVAGNVVYIQNLKQVDNGTNGAGGQQQGGANYTAASGIADRNVRLTDPDATFPLLDRGALAAAQFPDYEVGFARPVTPTPLITQRITAEDSPKASPPFRADVTEIDVVLRFRLFLVWRFGTAPNGIIYTLGIKEWYVVFLADTFVAGQGVTRNLFPFGVVTVIPFNRNHDNPVVKTPIANDAIAWV